MFFGNLSLPGRQRSVIAYPHHPIAVPYSSLESTAPEWEHWLLFFLRSMKKQKDNLLKKVERERHFLQTLSRLATDILELARENGRISTAEVVMATQANRATIRKYLEELVRNGMLQQHGKGKGTWYSLF